MRIARDYLWISVLSAIGVFIGASEMYSLKMLHINAREVLSAALLSTAVVLLVRRLKRLHRNIDRKTVYFLEERHRLHLQQQSLLRLATSELRHQGDILPAIQELLEIAAHTLQTPRTAFWQLDSPSRLRCVDLYTEPDKRHQTGIVVNANERPSLFRSMHGQRAMVIHELKTSAFAEEAKDLIELGISSLIIAPVRQHGVLAGLLCFAHRGDARHWTIDEQQYAGSLADMLALIFQSAERRQIKDALECKEQEAARMALFASLCPAPILRFDSNGVIIAANSAAETLMGLDLSSNELSPPTLSELIPGAAELDVIACINSGAEIKSLLKLHERSYQFLIRGVPELGCGHVYGVDITDLKKTQQRLIESKTFLQQVVDSCPSLIYVKDSAGRYIFANKAAAAFYGLDMKSLMWRTAEQLGVTGEVLTAQNAIETEVLTTQKEVLNHEELMIDASGEDHILHTVRRPLASYDVFERQVLTVATDISELKSLQEELMHSRKMDAVGQLAGGIAHDFNNLLTGILGCTGILRLHTDRMPELLQVTETIETAAQRAGQLTQKMLGFARRGKHQNIPVDIHSTIEETLQLLRRTIQKNIKIEAKLCAQASHVLGDPTQLQQIVLNLAINARDAMTADIMGSDGGSLTIQTRHISAEEAGLRDPEKEYGMFLELAVSDTGCGMSSAIREKAFDPFFTTKPPGKGTGMGLAMVYGIVKNHDGFVKIDSMEGIGTTVSVIFPALDSPSVKAVKALPPRPISGRGRILVVDDHTIVRSITCKMLSSLGYSVATASDGIEAIEYYKNNYKQIDLVILDMVMPRMGARDCFRALQRICPHVRAVLSTGYVNNNAVQEILDEGLNGFLQKPYELIKLSEVVATILNADESELRISSHLNLISAQKAPH